ncbi:MAG TPA: hypothetical protein VNS32_08600 [Flavisolibacter sp.]|nr:hypothetical protein [Flavisolibacter sp.]
MKKFITLLIAAFIIGFLCIATLHWLFRMDNTQSFVLAFTAGFTGIIVEYLRPFLTKDRQQN